MRRKKMGVFSGKMSLFLAGFVLMAIAHLAIQCEKSITPPDDNDDPIVIDGTQATTAAEAMENAFLSGKSEKVLELFTPSALETYSDMIKETSAENLKAFGEAFKTRSLELISERYAEFKFMVDGTEYSIALSLDSDGTWKIMRL